MQCPGKMVNWSPPHPMRSGELVIMHFLYLSVSFVQKQFGKKLTPPHDLSNANGGFKNYFSVQIWTIQSIFFLQTIIFVSISLHPHLHSYEDCGIGKHSFYTLMRTVGLLNIAFLCRSRYFLQLLTKNNFVTWLHTPLGWMLGKHVFSV